MGPSTFVATFSEGGLPPGTSWSVAMNGVTINSTGVSITFAEPNGTYAYSVGTVSGYSAMPSFGVETINGSAVTQPITFSEEGRLQVSVTPANAGVTVNGKTTSGTAGMYVWTLRPGSYYVNASLPGYTPYSNLVTVRAGVTVVVSVVLTPVTTFGYLAGTVTPTSATVIANGVVVPVEGGTFNVTLAPGAYYLSVTAAGYVSLVTEANISEGQATHVTLVLAAVPTTVTFSGEVSPANGSVMVNGIVAYVNATGQFNVPVVAGTYVVSVFALGYFPYSENLTISSNLWIDFILTKEPGSTSAQTSSNVTATGYNVTITGVTNGDGNISVTFTSRTNGTLLVSVPYSDIENATIADVLSSRVYVNGIRYTSFAVTITTNYTVILTVRELSGDPTLFWALSPSATPPSPSHSGSGSNFLGLPDNLGYYLVGAAGTCLVAVAASRRWSLDPETCYVSV